MKLERFTPQALMFNVLAVQFDKDLLCNCCKEREALDKSMRLMEDAIGSNRQLKLLYEQLVEAYDNLHKEERPHYYKNGFLFGAQLMMEILGCQLSDENKGKLDELLSYLAKMQ